VTPPLAGLEPYLEAVNVDLAYIDEVVAGNRAEAEEEGERKEIQRSASDVIVESSEETEDINAVAASASVDPVLAGGTGVVSADAHVLDEPVLVQQPQQAASATTHRLPSLPIRIPNPTPHPAPPLPIITRDLYPPPTTTSNPPNRNGNPAPTLLLRHHQYRPTRDGAKTPCCAPRRSAELVWPTQTQTTPLCAQLRCSRASRISVLSSRVPCASAARRFGLHCRGVVRRSTCLCRRCRVRRRQRRLSLEGRAGRRGVARGGASGCVACAVRGVWEAVWAGCGADIDVDVGGLDADRWTWDLGDRSFFIFQS
jgi:hypothetical protein